MFEFRRYKIKQGNKQVKHPKLIVDENNSQYGFMGLTSSKYKGAVTKISFFLKIPNLLMGKDYLNIPIYGEK